MKKAINILNLSHFYGKSYVLNKISFNISKGSFFVIVGPNGSGKTTLLRLITGIEKITSGLVEIMGLPLRSYTNRQLAQILAYVPQNIPIDFPFKVSEVVSMGRSPHLGLLGFNTAKDKKIVMEAMRFTGVDNLSDRMMYQLSAGERQRVFIARAICQQPRIIVLDEPTAALDISHQIKVMDLMEELVTKNNVTVVMVLHDINLAAMYCDNLLLIKSGFFVKKGKPNKILTVTTLKNTYGCRMIIDESPFANISRYIPIPGRYYQNNE